MFGFSNKEKSDKVRQDAACIITNLMTAKSIVCYESDMLKAVKDSTPHISDSEIIGLGEQVLAAAVMFQAAKDSLNQGKIRAAKAYYDSLFTTLQSIATVVTSLNQIQRNNVTGIANGIVSIREALEAKGIL